MAKNKKLVEFQKNSNQATKFQNLKTIVVYIIIIYGFYVLFTAGFFIFNIWANCYCVIYNINIIYLK